MIDRIDGSLLAVTTDGIVGWALNQDKPHQRLRVILLVGGKPIAGATADRFDLSNVQTLAGPGTPGFAVRLAAPPPDKPPFEIALRALNGRKLGSPLLIRSAEQLQPAIAATAQAEYEGFVDLMRDGRIVGWVRDRANPDRSVQVEVFDGPQRIGRTVANQSREDLRAAGIDSGEYGFELQLPISLLDMQVHHLRIVTEDGKFEPVNSPLSFGPLTCTLSPRR